MKSFLSKTITRQDFFKIIGTLTVGFIVAQLKNFNAGTGKILKSSLKEARYYKQNDPIAG